MSPQRRVLIIDDEDSLREMVGLALELEGYEVLSAPDGVRGLEIIRQHDPDVVLLDMRMPGMDGWQFMEAYRREPVQRARVIIFTAAQDSLARVEEAKANAVLPKPFDLDQLLALVAQDGA
jgi:two-component system OmpR family response regulator